MSKQRYTDYTIPQRYQVSCRGYQDDSVLAHDAEQEGKLVSITEAEYQAQVEADAADYWQQRSQLESTDMVTLPGTIVTMRATEAAAELAQICHGLRAGLTIAERVYAPKGLGNLANEWLLARCDNGAMVKETPIEDSELSLYEPYWKPLETSEFPY